MNPPRPGPGRLSFLKDSPRPVVFLKAADTHDFKFSAAVFEDYHHVSPAWRDRHLACGMFILRGSADKGNALVDRTHAALKS